MDTHSTNEYSEELRGRHFTQKEPEKKSPLFWMSITVILVVLIIVGLNSTQPSRKPVLLNT